MQNPIIGLGEASLDEQLAAAGIGAAIPLTFMGVFLLYLLTSGTSATERRKRLRDADSEYRAKVERIKKDYPRVRL